MLINPPCALILFYCLNTLSETMPLPSFLEIDRLQKDETKKEADDYMDLFTTKNIKLKERVLIPVKQYPKVSLSFFFFFVSFHREPSDLIYPDVRFQLHKATGLLWSLKVLLRTLISKLQRIITADSAVF